jgi:hypothetical protein
MSAKAPRRCDATCHWAKKLECACFCAGLFHGEEGRERFKQFLDELGVEAAWAAVSSPEEFELLAPEHWAELHRTYCYANAMENHDHGEE